METWPLIEELLDLVHEATCNATRMIGTRHTLNKINERAAPLLQRASQRAIVLRDSRIVLLDSSSTFSQPCEIHQ